MEVLVYLIGTLRWGEETEKLTSGQSRERCLKNHFRPISFSH